MNSKIYPFLSLLAIGQATAVETVFTDPIGYVKLGNTADTAPAAVSANTDVWISVPLEPELQFSGTVLSADAANNTITVSGSPGWVADIWASDPAVPHQVIVGSGLENGLRGLIVGNTANTLSITQSTPGSLSQLTSGDSISLRKAWTLESFFANSSISDGCQVLCFDETETGIDHVSGPEQSFIFFGGNWFDGSSSPANNRILYPGEMFIFRSSSTPVAQLSIFGDVPLSSHRVSIVKDGAGEEDLELALASPVPKLVGELTIPAENGDLLLLSDSSIAEIDKASGPADSLVFFAGEWFDGFSNPVNTTYSIPPGSGFRFRRAASSTSGPIEWIEPAAGIGPAQ